MMEAPLRAFLLLILLCLSGCTENNAPDLDPMPTPSPDDVDWVELFRYESADTPRRFTETHAETYPILYEIREQALSLREDGDRISFEAPLNQTEPLADYMKRTDCPSGMASCYDSAFVLDVDYPLIIDMGAFVTT